MAEKTNNKNDNPVKVEKLNDYKILIVYLSRTKNTQALAEIIHENLGGDLHALELLTPYPEDYQTMVDQVAEENSSGYLPPLKTKIENEEKRSKSLFKVRQAFVRLDIFCRDAQFHWTIGLQDFEPFLFVRENHSKPSFECGVA